MASNAKKKTTMAKLMRESRLRERRLDKQAKKEARKLAPIDHADEVEPTLTATGEPAPPSAGDTAPEAVVQALPDA